MQRTSSPAGEVSACGLFCGACRSYLKGRCPGCKANQSAGWCRVRSCCQQHGYHSCAECTEHPDPRRCKHFDNWIARGFGLVFNSDRAAGIAFIRREGSARFAAYMYEHALQSIPRRGPIPERSAAEE